MKPQFDHPCLVRGVVSAQDKWHGPDERVTANTFWYRHDGDLDRLEHETERLVQFYMSNPGCTLCSVGYEYKEYRE